MGGWGSIGSYLKTRDIIQGESRASHTNGLTKVRLPSKVGRGPQAGGTKRQVEPFGMAALGFQTDVPQQTSTPVLDLASL
jgi:hypothetical protein